MSKLTNCIICGSKTKKLKKVFLFEKTINKDKMIKLRECIKNDCKHIFQVDYNKKDLENHYKYPRHISSLNNFDQLYFKDRKNFIVNNSNYSKVSTMLEVGPGDQYFLKQFNNVDRYYFDLNPQTNRILKKFYKFNNISYSKKKFDLICMCHVLEHVYNPTKFLNFLKKKLSIKKNFNGIFFIEVPDFTYMNEPDKTDGFIYEHLHYFSMKSLIKLFERVNINILSIRIHLDTNNRSCQNYILQAVCTLNNFKKRYDLISLWKNKNLEIKKIFLTALRENKKIIFWGIGGSFFKFVEGLKIKKSHNITLIDQRDYDKTFKGLSIFKQNSIKNKKVDIVIVCTSELENVKINLKKLKVTYKNIYQVKS